MRVNVYVARGEAAAALLDMTPFVRAAPAERQRDLRARAETHGIRTTLDMIVSTHRVWLGTGNGQFEL